MFETVESAAFLQSTKRHNLETTRKDHFEAYVTFVDTESAYLAHNYFNQKHKPTAFSIQPASTWHQPSVTSIEKLNEHCLLHIFKFCDLPTLAQLSETCIKFNEILHRGVFTKFKSFSVYKNVKGYVNDWNKQTPQLYGNLAVIRKILKCIGAYLVEISINWTYSTKAMHIKRLFQTINKYSGVNVRILEIGTRGLNLLSETLLQEIQPMLNRIQTLKLSLYSTCNFPLHLLCPNLEKLDLQFYRFHKTLCHSSHCKRFC